MSNQDCTTYCVYRIVCFPTAKIYIGITTRPRIRRKEHFRNLRLQTHPNQKLQRAYNKYGANTFYFEIIERDIRPEDIDRRERYWITHYNSYHDGYNATPGGDAIANTGKSCTWNGIQYKTVVDAAKAVGISPSGMHMRLKRGWICDTDVKPKGRGKRLVPCVWNGIAYLSITDAAHASGLMSDTLQARIKAGYKSDADMLKIHSKECEWNGIKYPSVNKAAKANRISITTLLERLEKGYSCDADMKRIHTGKCVWNGIEYPSYTAASRANGVSSHTIRWRILQGYTCDDDMK